MPAARPSAWVFGWERAYLWLVGMQGLSTGEPQAGADWLHSASGARFRFGPRLAPSRRDPDAWLTQVRRRSGAVGRKANMSSNTQ
jgi:hypothetical protein